MGLILFIQPSQLSLSPCVFELPFPLHPLCILVHSLGYFTLFVFVGFISISCRLVGIHHFLFLFSVKLYVVLASWALKPWSVWLISVKACIDLSQGIRFLFTFLISSRSLVLNYFASFSIEPDILRHKHTPLSLFITPIFSGYCF